MDRMLKLNPIFNLQALDFFCKTVSKNKMKELKIITGFNYPNLFHSEMIKGSKGHFECSEFELHCTKLYILVLYRVLRTRPTGLMLIC